MRAELRIPRDPAFVGLARLVVARAARLAGVRQDRVEDVKIAVAESLAAAMPGADGAAADDTVELEFGVGPTGFEVIVNGVDEPPEVTEGGAEPAIDVLDPKLGLTLIEGLTDEFGFVPDGTRMRLRFVVGLA